MAQTADPLMSQQVFPAAARRPQVDRPPRGLAEEALRLAASRIERFGHQRPSDRRGSRGDWTTARIRVLVSERPLSWVRAVRPERHVVGGIRRLVGRVATSDD